MKGKFNSNAGKCWSDEKKAEQSKIVQSKVDDEYRQRCASANKGVKFDENRIYKMHGHRNVESYSRPHTDESKRLIGIKSAQKFTKAYWLKLRAKMYDEGLWIDPNDKDDYAIYYWLADWVKPMWNLFEAVPGGVFNSRSNPQGMVRDHIFSRKDGLELGIWPELLRHPVNCQLLTHPENVSKRSKSWYTYQELCDKIIKYEQEWFEQDICLARINEYSNGKTWIRKEASDELNYDLRDF